MSKSKTISLIAIFTAIGVVLNIFASSMPRIDVFGRISLIYAYCLIAGVMLGWLKGGIVAAISDIIVAILFPEGAYMPLITLSNSLMAVFAGLCYQYIKINSTIIKVAIAAVISFGVCTLVLTALGESILYSYFGSAAYYPSITALIKASGVSVYQAFVIRKVIIQPFWIVLNFILAIGVLKAPIIRKLYPSYSYKRGEKTDRLAVA